MNHLLSYLSSSLAELCQQPGVLKIESLFRISQRELACISSQLSAPKAEQLLFPKISRTPAGFLTTVFDSSPRSHTRRSGALEWLS